MHFLSSYSKCMQQVAPLLHIFTEEVESLVLKLLLRFLDATYVSTLSTLSEVDDDDNYVPLGEVFVSTALLYTLKMLWKTFFK